MKVDFQFPPCRTYSASKYPPIDFAVLWGVLHNRKYTHSPANGIRYAAIRCFTKEPHRGDNYFTLFVILALQRKNRWFSTLRCKNRRHPTEVECRLFFPILFRSCRFRNSLKLLSYRHTPLGPSLFVKTVILQFLHRTLPSMKIHKESDLYRPPAISVIRHRCLLHS